MNANGLVRLYLFVDGISQRAAKAFETNFGDISFSEDNAFAEGERVGSVEVDVNTARLTVPGEFEVMMFEVGQAVAHVFFSACDLLMPESCASALEPHLAGYVSGGRLQDELGAEADG